MTVDKKCDVGGYLVFFIIFIAYAVTAPHTVTFEDSGIFLTTSSQLGIPHPPGYSLFTILGFIFSKIPISTVAYRIHLMNALFGALSCTLLYRILLSFNLRKVIAAGSALALGFSFTFWSQSIIAEVYALHALIVLAMIWILVRNKIIENKYDFLLIGLLFGLGLTNHWPLLLLCAPGLVILIWENKNQAFKFKYFILTGLAIGLLPLLYLPLVSLLKPKMAFLGSISSIAEFISYISRDYYKNTDLQLTGGFMQNVYFFISFLKMMLTEVTLVFPVLFLLGLKRSWTTLGRTQFFGLLSLYLSSSLFLLFFLFLEFNDFHKNVYSVFQMIPFAVGCVFYGFGIAAVHDYLKTKTANTSISSIAYSVVIGLIVITTGWELFNNFNKNNLRNESFAADFAKLTLNDLPQGATLITRGDSDASPAAYVSLVEGYRSDVTLTNQQGLLFHERIFLPQVENRFDRQRKTISYIQEKGTVYSTYYLSLIDNPRSEGLQVGFNGLYYSWNAANVTSADFAKSGLASENLKKDVLSFADKYANNYSGQWQYHRDANLQTICDFILHNKLTHRIINENSACDVVKARYLLDDKRYVEADKLFKKVMAASTGLSLRVKADLNFDYLRNKAELINGGGGSVSEKVKSLQDLVDEVWPSVENYMFCDNKTVMGLLSVKAKFSDVNIRLPLLHKSLRECQNLKIYFQPLL
ncbi:MAG: DUF2723 domain-containing protein [Bdellovibrionales bacterium]|nr:DUF2723 domain-containing protein [Bdellovibrionales bacterium]